MANNRMNPPNSRGQRRSATSQAKAPSRNRPRSAEAAQFRNPVKNFHEPVIMLGRFDTPFLILVLTLLGIGLVTLFSASHASSYYYMDNSYYYILRQLLFAVAGVIAMLAVSLVNYRFLRNFCWLAYVVSLVLMAMCYLFPGQNGAQRWINLGFLTFQPSEIAKFAVILLFAHLMDRDRDKMGLMVEGTLRYLVLYGAVAVILLPQPHLSGTLLIGIIVLVMMFLGGTKFSNLLKIGIPVLILGLLAAFVLRDFIAERFAHVVTRLTYWLDPFSTTDAGSYQTRQSLLAIGSGGLWGVGFGESRQKHMYLPEVRNDFVFAIVCEELGFIGACIVIVLFAMLVWRGYVIAMNAKDRFGSLLVTGITTQIGIQAFLNIAVVTNLIPNTGISLPFFSYGGTALLIMLGEIGVILSVSRQARHTKE